MQIVSAYSVRYIFIYVHNSRCLHQMHKKQSIDLFFPLLSSHNRLDQFLSLCHPSLLHHLLVLLLLSFLSFFSQNAAIALKHFFELLSISIIMTHDLIIQLH